MWCKAVLLVAVSLVMFCVVKTTDAQEQSVEKRGQANNTQTTVNQTTLADVIKILKDHEKRCLTLFKKGIKLLAQDYKVKVIAL
jgi:hypothetical protein